MQRNDPCWCHSGKKFKHCHWPVQPKDTAAYARKHHILLKTPSQIEGIRKAAKLTAYILDAVCKAAVAGVTTEELNQIAVDLHKKHKAIAAPLGYGSPPYPKSICTSLNEVVCHGIPGKTVLKEGDILNIDVSTLLDGYYGDCSRMVMIGEVSEERRLVTEVSYECLMRAIAILKPGIPLKAIGDVITDYAESHNCSVVHQFIGHGIGIEFHEEPQILHSRNNNQIQLMPGMTFTIEPMINAGKAEAIIDRSDRWTARTIDGRASAQWEHTLLITEEGHEILTLPPS